MRAIFISYRRDDTEGEAGRLFDDLVLHFGEDAVFMDVAGIAPGRDFRKAIDESVATCGVLLAVMGKRWVDAKNEAGERRLEDPGDFVRLETASALKRDIPVIPVLVHGATMPVAQQLPDDLKELAYRNGMELTHPRWKSDVELLIKALTPHAGAPRSQPEHAVNQPAAAATPVAKPTVAPVETAPAPKASRKPLYKWLLVAFFIVGSVGQLSVQTDDYSAVYGGLVIAGLLAWDPFKWFRVKVP